MKTEIVRSLTAPFEGYAQQAESNVGARLVRNDHFVDVNKMVQLA